MILPAFGIVSQVISTFSRKPIFGYLGMVYAMGIDRFYWLYCVGSSYVYSGVMSADLRAYFMLATIIIAVPTGIKIFSWIATMWVVQLLKHQCCFQ